MTGRNRRRSPAAFTLVELLVVITIIALLVAVLLPAFGLIKKSARETAARAQFNALATGIETFRGEAALGSALPPSAGDIPSHPHLQANPHARENNNIMTPSTQTSGAHLLYQAMVGADGLGTPGFRDTDQDGFWADETHMGPNGAYEINEQTGQPRRTRYGGGGYVDDKMRQEARSLVELQQLGVIHNWSTVPNVINTTGEMKLFVDPWDHPILYYKATPSGTVMVNQQSVTGQNNPRGIYRQQDNGLITGTRIGAGSYDPRGIDFGPGFLGTGGNSVLHGLTVIGPAPMANNMQAVDAILTNNNYENSFNRFILDTSVRAKPTPVRSDSYLLISAGADSRYGTSDDILNWQKNP